MGNLCCKRSSSVDIDDEPLLRAVRRRDLKGVRKVLNSKAYGTITAALVEAAGIANRDILQCIINAEDINLRSPSGKTALVEAVSSDRRDSAQALLNSGADPNICEASSGDSPLMLAVRKESIEMIQTLVRFGADVNCLNIKKQSALMIACQLGRVEIVKVLVLKGAHLSASDAFSKTAVMYAAEKKNNHIVDYLQRLLTRSGVGDTSTNQEPANSEDGVCGTMDDGSHALRDIVVDGEKDTTHSPSQDHDVIFKETGDILKVNIALGNVEDGRGLDLNTLATCVHDDISTQAVCDNSGIFTQAVCDNSGISTQRVCDNSGISTQTVCDNSGISTQTVCDNSGISTQRICDNCGISTQTVCDNSGISTQTVCDNSGISTQTVCDNSGISTQTVCDNSGISTQRICDNSGISTQTVCDNSGISTETVCDNSGISTQAVCDNSGISTQRVCDNSGISTQRVCDNSGISTQAVYNNSGISTLAECDNSNLSTLAISDKVDHVNSAVCSNVDSPTLTVCGDNDPGLIEGTDTIDITVKPVKSRPSTLSVCGHGDRYGFELDSEDNASVKFIEVTPSPGECCTPDSIDCVAESRSSLDTDSGISHLCNSCSCTDDAQDDSCVTSPDIFVTSPDIDAVNAATGTNDDSTLTSLVARDAHGQCAKDDVINSGRSNSRSSVTDLSPVGNNNTDEQRTKKQRRKTKVHPDQAKTFPRRSRPVWFEGEDLKQVDLHQNGLKVDDELINDRNSSSSLTHQTTATVNTSTQKCHCIFTPATNIKLAKNVCINSPENFLDQSSSSETDQSSDEIKER
ncbi:hypothetical protein Btru_011435 [Bulinus truncatus]|nr:hypothetical protein Btru_011435 [Bulinus truncatus]